MDNFLPTRECCVRINGSHYFGCDYIFSNIYGSAVFNDDDRDEVENDVPEGSMLCDPEKGEYSPETLEQFINDDAGVFDISTMPDCRKEIEYSTDGTIQSDGKGGVIIRYSGDFTPICMHASDNLVTLNGQEDDFCELIFERGKRNYVALPETLFSEESADHNENQSPLQLCISTESVDNNITENGGELHVSYSIEVNGLVAEVTDFTLHAVISQPMSKEGQQ